MPLLKVQELAEARGFNMSSLSRRADVSVNTARRYWHGTTNGKPDGPLLEELNVSVLQAIAKVLGVPFTDLIIDAPAEPQ